nr:3842_t:CDS:2 [Entrophospora candida]
MAFLFKHKELEISICLNGTKDEIVIPADQLLGFKIINNLNNFNNDLNENHKNKNKSKNVIYNILLKFKPNFKRMYQYHLGGFPYLLDPTVTDDDPTNGKLDQSSFVNLVTTNQNTNELSLKLIESAIDTSWFQKYQLENESIIEDDNQNIYITCVFPTERRAISFPIDASFNQLLKKLEQRFGTKIFKYVYYKNCNNDMIMLSDEAHWKLAKNELIGGNDLKSI